MANGAGGHAGTVESTSTSSDVGLLPVGDNNAIWSEAGVSPVIIEISDRDYRSFCLPCHALEEEGDCNAGY